MKPCSFTMRSHLRDAGDALVHVDAEEPVQAPRSLLDDGDDLFVGRVLEQRLLLNRPGLDRHHEDLPHAERVHALQKRRHLVRRDLPRPADLREAAVLLLVVDEVLVDAVWREVAAKYVNGAGRHRFSSRAVGGRIPAYRPAVHAAVDHDVLTGYGGRIVRQQEGDARTQLSHAHRAAQGYASSNALAHRPVVHEPGQHVVHANAFARVAIRIELGVRAERAANGAGDREHQSRLALREGRDVDDGTATLLLKDGRHDPRPS